jgi:hypothetical protein
VLDAGIRLSRSTARAVVNMELSSATNDALDGGSDATLAVLITVACNSSNAPLAARAGGADRAGCVAASGIKACRRGAPAYVLTSLQRV